MKVAVSSTGKDLDATIDPRFGRCAIFLIVETDDMSFEAFENDSGNLSGGAGIQSAQFVAAKGAKAVITGNCGPNAVQTLAASGVDLFTGQYGVIKDALDAFTSSKLKASNEPNVPDHSGMQQSQPVSPGSRMGGGRGMGGRGRGMGGGGGGMGGGRGMGGGGMGR